VVLSTATVPANRDVRTLQNDILLLCRETLSTYKVPAIINFVPALAVAESGKMIRQNA
jgi:acyl-coenzyme A synthetase/AMP-(fatty) acid ligase